MDPAYDIKVLRHQRRNSCQSTSAELLSHFCGWFPWFRGLRGVDYNNTVLDVVVPAKDDMKMLRRVNKSYVLINKWKGVSEEQALYTIVIDDLCAAMGV